ncbi:MAG TPA: cytochrome c maturation protein CcmE [Anaerolineaceae bacterium]|nr:cytochrome c maturation protein CcmE [Anaerolineaceae bacterium]
MQTELTAPPVKSSANRFKFIAGGVLILAAVVYLIATSLVNPGGAQYFLTVDELNERGASMVGESVRISGAVLGDSITYDPQTMNLTFEIAHVPAESAMIEDEGGLAAALHAAVMDPSRQRLTVHYNGVKPDLLQNEAQAIVTGKMGEDGIFYAEDLLLKCPTKYEEAVPQQASSDLGTTP